MLKPNLVSISQYNFFTFVNSTHRLRYKYTEHEWTIDTGPTIEVGNTVTNSSVNIAIGQSYSSVTEC